MMRTFPGWIVVVLTVLLSACSEQVLPSEAAREETRFAADAVAPLPPIRFSELHYDNAGTDAGEAIEISGPAGSDLTGWQVVLYNGSNGASYNTRPLSGTIEPTCDPRGVVVLEYPSNGIQNGAPDGMALVDGAGAVIEFLSWEGTFTAVDGPAAGMTSTNMGGSQSGSTAGTSLQRNETNGWSELPETFGTCNDADVSLPPPPPPPPTTNGSTFITEFHYDNEGTDAGEAIEIEGIAGADLSGWQVLLYNGNGGTVYGTTTLSATIPDQCDGRGVIVVSYPSNGIQNGSPDGIALVDGDGAVTEFISYEGSLTATAGAASGMTSVDVGVSQTSSTPAGQSLQRNSAGVWEGPLAQTFNLCNGGGAPPPPPAPTTGSVVIHELMAAPVNASGGPSWGEWFEVHNPGATPIDLAGWTIASDGQSDHVIATSVIVPAGGYVVLGRGDDPARNGGIAIAYNYFNGNTATTIWLDDTDWLELRDGSGAVVDRVTWTTSPAPGVTRGVRDATVENASVDGSNWGYATATFGDGDYGTPGAANGALASEAPSVVVPATISFSGRASDDPPLPVGFEDQLFATLRAGGSTVETTWTWSSETPELASVDADGVVHALGAGTAVIRATAADGTTATTTVPTHVAVASNTADYRGNAEFGEPADGDESDDITIRRAQFTASYNPQRNTPNWVSYNLEATHFGGEDRCDCFTADPELPASVARVTTADYTGAGTAAGFGIARGHLARSFDRTAGSLDNATTYYFSNIIPQTAANNQGPWAAFENEVGNFARFENREVYVIAGVAGNAGTLKNEGLVVIPSAVWKVVVVLPRDHGLADVEAWDDPQVTAVIMPNIDGIRERRGRSSSSRWTRSRRSAATICWRCCRTTSSR